MYQGYLEDLRHNPLWLLLVAQVSLVKEAWIRRLVTPGQEDNQDQLRGGVLALEAILAIPQIIEEYEVTDQPQAGITPSSLPTNQYQGRL